MKRIGIISAISLAVLPAVAQDAGLQGITSTTEGVGNYIPVMQGLCFVIAAAAGIAGSVYAYYQVQKGEQPEKYVVGTVGSAMTFVVMALFLPQFFGYTSSPSEGLMAQNSGSGGGDSTSAIITEIPDINDPVWLPDPIYSGGTPTFITPGVTYVWIPPQISGPVFVTMDYVHYVP